MANHDGSAARESAYEPDEQPPALVDLLRSLDVAGKSLALYGPEHSITAEQLNVFVSAVVGFLAASRRATCVFGKDILIVNENSYAPSEASQALAHRLRARGVMAITFVGEPSRDEALRFVAFLNAEPRHIRVEGGPSDYLRKRAVTRIVATEAVYVSDGDDPEDSPPRGPVEPTDVDRAIAYAIEWLSKQEGEEEVESPRLPITEILSDPDKAARLIREAVSKLHVSRRHYTDGELATEVINDLKDLASADAETWDNATPQIRRAIAKLPREMMPAASGFTDEEADASGAERAAAEIQEIEVEVTDILAKCEADAALPEPQRFERLFGAKASGLLSSWRAELQPNSVIRSSGRTLSTLMVWENSASEHYRIVNALAALIPRAVEMDDIDSALEFAEHLLAESCRTDGGEWRAAAARAALQNIDSGVAVELVQNAMRAGGRRAEEVCAGLITAIRGIALELIPMLETHGGGPFGQALRAGIVECRQAALVPLGRTLRTGPAESRITALELVAAISGPSAANEIAAVVAGTDHLLAVRALDILPTVRVPSVVDICVRALGHACVEVRCAAARALGELQMDEAFENLARLAKRRGLRAGDIPVKLAVVSALERCGRPEAIQCLDAMANHAPLFNRSRYQAVRESARHAADALRKRLGDTRSEAA